MLPLHSQYTAAIDLHIGQVLPTKLKIGNVFNKQTEKYLEKIYTLILLI